MSRRSQKGWRGRAVAELFIDAVETLAPSARVLVAYDETASVARHVTESGRTAETWNRRLTDKQPSAPWPEGGGFDAAMLRLPQTRDEQEMALHAVASTVRPGGRVLVCGANDEGIKVATPRIAKLLGNAEKLTARAHCRMIGATRPEVLEGLRSSLADWRRTIPIDIDGNAREWVFYPGLFAEGHVDDGTRLLLDHLPDLPAGSRVLDFGTGSGIIAAYVQARQPAAEIDMLDIDQVALAAAGENVPGAHAIAGRDLSATGSVRYGAIISNPPFHAGHEESHDVLAQLIEDAPAHLAPGGWLLIVVQRRIPAVELLRRSFKTVTMAAETSSYRVWHARAPHRERA